ncbi:MAG: hypothetical protein A3F35_02755 [Candidatus Woykebacteria bacterium RIFCSPHIGHO2_12_FULL_45_10]|uniref:Transposase IS200-like domain-containing protein n=1 Tax=Candidatus Woykebacteria bacterium RIFCSPHIGHO2_12_FULL_45_10 TaxID=1802603 RepID=A0A1G1WPA8_9BACT|nr:MAG: hypothetical protein A3F35_02755 [Candidatus Woykebacteria bacterium RIFCSPHIGHO2_12_FULL_45_10]
MRPPRNFVQGDYYHLICRGNNQNIFLGNKDYIRFLENLDNYSGKFSIKIFSFALMPNHVHLLVRQDSEIPISKFMQVLTTAHANYFNLKHRRTGHLFESRFKHIGVETDEYLVHLSRYIHLNPSSANIVTKPESYPWSSYRTFLKLEALNFVDRDTVLGYFSSKNPIRDYQEFVESRINYQKDISYQKLLLE